MSFWPFWWFNNFAVRGDGDVQGDLLFAHDRCLKYSWNAILYPSHSTIASNRWIWIHAASNGFVTDGGESCLLHVATHAIVGKFLLLMLHGASCLSDKMMTQRLPLTVFAYDKQMIHLFIIVRNTNLQLLFFVIMLSIVRQMDTATQIKLWECIYSETPIIPNDPTIVITRSKRHQALKWSD